MKINIKELVLSANRFSKYNPMQEECIKKGFARSMVVSSPTASGKTITAELFMLEMVLNENKKVIYTCPLRALASEHYADFKKKYTKQASSNNIKFAVSTGDLDSSSSYLKNFDVIMTTYEKLSSLLRHKAEWLSQVGGVIIDEMHELDSDRGPVLEIALTQMQINNPKIKVLGLSATIPNVQELAKWLKAELVESDYRPIKLREGVLLENEVEYNDGTTESGGLEDIIKENLAKKKQLLVFMNARKRAEAKAKEMAEFVGHTLDSEEKRFLEKIADTALNALESPTEQCTTLAGTIKQGTAFHHAGLVGKQREIVEESFRNGKIKILCATPTLAAGVNTPADIVIIPSLYRFEKYGMNLIAVREYKQQAGRSGRPKFSTEGKSIIIATSDAQKEMFTEKYINGKTEAILSRLGIIPILRTHILALIATGYISDIKTIESFFERTLYAHQLQNMGELIDNVLEITSDLEKFEFIKREGEIFRATTLGKRVSDLFLDPESAHELITVLKERKTFTAFSYLYAWVNCTEFSPWMNPPAKAKPLVLEELASRVDELPFRQEKTLFEPEAIEKFFSALMLEQWINEKHESELFTNYGLAPGLLFGKTQIIEWLSYATIELSKVLGIEKHLINSQKLSKRVKHGVKEELLLLVELKGIGRVRARKLFSIGIKKPSEVKANIEKVEALLGKKVADLIKHQLKLNESNPNSMQNTLN